MEQNNTNKSNKFFKSLKQNKKFFVYFYFVAISTVFWLLNSLNKDYSTNIIFPVKYIHSFPDKILVDDYPTEITLNVKAHGYTLVRHIINARNHKLLISLLSSSFNEIPNDPQRKYYIISKSLKERFQRQLPELQINEILPDTLFYKFSNVISKKIPVIPNIHIDFEQQYMQHGRLIIRPDSIIITGSKASLDTISNIKTQYYWFSKINKTQIANLNLSVINDVSLSITKVSLIIPADKYTEYLYTIPIVTINVPDNLTLKIFPSSVNVAFKVAIKDFNKVKPQLFNFVVDFNEIEGSNNKRLNVNLDRSPSFISNISYVPKTVDYIIEK